MVLGIPMLFSNFFHIGGELKTISKSSGAFALFLDFDESDVVDLKPVVVVLFIGSLM